MSRLMDNPIVFFTSAIYLFGLAAVIGHDTRWPERSFYLAFGPAVGLFVHFMSTGGNLA